MKTQMAAAILTAILLTSLADAQDYNAIIQQQLQAGEQLSRQMTATQNGFVQQNMQNPQVQAQYQSYRNSGGQMSFEQFAYGYAATGGYTPQGMSSYNQNEQNIARREQQSVQAYRQSQAQNAQVLEQMHESNARIADDRGNLLSGNSRYVDPGTGQTYVLPYTSQPGSTYNDAGSGQNFYKDENYNYRRTDPNGYTYDIDEEE